MLHIARSCDGRQLGPWQTKGTTVVTKGTTVVTESFPREVVLSFARPRR